MQDLLGRPPKCDLSRFPTATGELFQPPACLATGLPSASVTAACGLLQKRETRDVQLRMLWLLLLLAGGSLGENAAPTSAPATPTTVPSTFPALETTTSLEDIVTKNLNLLESEVTERITTLVNDVTSTHTPTSSESSTTLRKKSVSSDSEKKSRSIEQKKTELISVPTSPVGPPLRSETPTFDLVDELVDGFVDEARFLANPFVIEVPIYSLANATTEFIKSPRMAFGKSPFLTGFGLGFLAFGLKKLLLPLFIGAQIVKSVLVALFLPTILGHIGKLVGKGLTSVATQSGSSGGNHDQVAEFDFKDAGGGYGDADTAGSDTMSTWTMPAAAAPAQSNAHATLAALNPGRTPGVSQTAQDRYTPRLPSHQIKQHFGSFYSKDPQSDFKVFNKIPSSSQLLTHYDPFYSPLLSRLDSVFKQLGTTSEGCRERLVCDMYRNPAKFAPFSNLVSAQLSRELNELRKPSSDNPEILRFFRYMKAAKDGQDGTKCDALHNACIAPTVIAENASPMVTTFNDINKLVHARKLSK
ncbi:hypothetical protein GE061_015477 [Apolygus lucorum]|uniref:Protein osiris 24 n=1 Tax=Apolygus lucorum TaxID=248454 RepID=A0A6A4J987_APOLU|nr:hypothetical protein GE061_015477 [Apolygus lucorum]